ncbi:hypothetical protein [Hyalangium rubrum]|uniref:Uncharacterized protein n=1 Tax=Hyalangium rubrum TaxID=3103134 RepID=A0ABU5GXX1_9BACT|nr:hypothetical protein [Hyalangium sp. s54d21]MDY7226023.1 hypothetical protein [Hyalangium sp. s54d21]
MLASCTRWGVTALWVGMLGTGCGGFNESPVVTVGPLVSDNDVLSGTEVAMRLTVTDKENDDITYLWMQTPEEPAGTYSDTHVREPHWTAPEVTTPTEFTLKVYIQDGEGGSLLSATFIRVSPRR